MSNIEPSVYLDEYIDLQKYWLVMKRRFLPATLTFVGVVGISLAYVFSLEPVYQAESKLLIEDNESSTLTGIENDIGKIQVVSTDSDPLATQAEIVRSRPVIDQLIQELDLRNEEGELLGYRDIADPLKVKVVTGTDILEISYQDNDPELATLIVNKVIEIYINEDTRVNRSQAAAARKFISQQLPQVETNVNQAEAELSRFKNENQIANLAEETTATIGKIDDIETQIDNITAELKEIDARYNRLRSQLGVSWQEASAIVSLSQSLAVKSIFERLQQIKVDLAQQGNYLSDNAPQIVNLKEEQAELQALLNREIAQMPGDQQVLLENLNVLALGGLGQGQIAEFAELGLNREGLQQKLATLKQIYNSHKRRLDTIPQLDERQRELERRVQAAQSTYEILLSKQQETQIAEEQNIGNVRIISIAEVPEKSIGSNKKLIVGGAAMMGALLGIAIAFLVDMQDRTIKNTQEIERMLPYPLQGIIPNYRQVHGKKQFILPDASNINIPKWAVTNILSSPITEAYHDLQVNLKLLHHRAANQVLVVTSAMTGEGKSSVAANLAIAEAQCDQKVLLVDADLRHPSQHYLWELPNDIGLANLLNQEVEWYDIVYRPMPNLDVMTSGMIPQHPASLLNSHSMEVFIAHASRFYDRVIFDTPPLVGIADTKILAKLVHGVLFVVRPGVANYSSINAAKKVLATTDIKVLGVVANGVDFHQEPYQDQQYYPNKKYLKPADESEDLLS